MSYYKRHSDPGGLVECIDRVLRTLRPIQNEFHGLYATGLSGILPAAVAAYRLKKPLVVLRKPNDHSHGSTIEGAGQLSVGSKLVIVDDFACTGLTIARLMQSLPPYFDIHGLVLYDQSGFKPDSVVGGLLRKTRRRRLYILKPPRAYWGTLKT